MQLTHLGPYELGEPLGKGGMGSVYAATDTQTGQRVAVKALAPHLAVAEGFRERFEAEIESLKTLHHEGIVRLYGYGEQEGVLFYSMELVDGISLEDELRAGRRFNWREVTSYAIQLSLALKHAHDHGIIHRDIKPANVLLYDEDRVKLTDFGIARLFGASQLTTAGGVLGTADYMSPEQAEGRPVTARCDQYSLGCVMYALLAGRPPFRANNLPQMLQLQRFAQPEPLRRYASDTPAQLEGVVMQLLSKDPAERFPNTQVLARHLQAMTKALSRPVADELSSGEMESAELPEVPNMATATPPPAGEALAEGREATNGDVSVQQAATLAAEGVEPAKEQVPAAPTSAPSRPVHFTTVEEEEEARRLAERRRSWLHVAAQLAGLVAVIGGMIALGVYLSRPPSADELYESITTQVKTGGGDSLAALEQQIETFFQRFPGDPRTDELREYQKKIAVDQTERRLQVAARRGGAAVAKLLPVEQLYVRAMGTLEDSRQEALDLLTSLVALYGDVGDGPPAGDDTDRHRRQALCVELAKRQMAKLQEELAERIERQLAVLEERLAVAGRLSASDPPRAARMYQAIIDLHQNDAWAEEIVSEARRRLKELDPDGTKAQ